MTRRGLLIVAMLLSSCEGSVGEVMPREVNIPPAPTTVPLSRCAEPTPPTAHPLRRLTPAQYRAQVRSTFHIEVADIAVPEHAAGQYDNDATLAAPTPSAVQRLIGAAMLVTERAMATNDWHRCEVLSAECAEESTLAVASSLFRRTLTEVERDAIGAHLRARSADSSPHEALGETIEALLMSPSFLYIGEAGTDGDAPDGRRPLSADERATRLSLFLWNEAATPEFRQRVADSDYEVLVEELLDEPRTREGFRRFFEQWLPTEAREGLDVTLFPELFVDEEVQEDMRASVARTLDYAFWEASSMEELFTGESFFINDRLAPFFDVEAPGSEALVPIAFPGERAGVLTHPGVLAATSEGVRHSPTRRGAFVMKNILCRAVLPPPPDVNDEALDGDREEMELATTRERLEQEHNSSVSCTGCHAEIDGIGYAFENFDGPGRYRTDENSVPVDASGQLNGVPYVGAGELGELLSDSDEVALCLSRHLFRYGMGRAETEADECQLRDIAMDLRDGDGDLRGLLRAFLLSPSFRHMPASD